MMKRSKNGKCNLWHLQRRSALLGLGTERTYGRKVRWSEGRKLSISFQTWGNI